MKHFDRFLFTTIVLDLVLFGVSDLFVPPLGFRLYGIVAVVLVSPALAYLLVYRLFD